ncbi:TolC family protein [Microbulbifer agarilyticus]|uniref:TolC family protein n=1 Tax=Microbulbifer agarilyticus TaxID=260552 RepID=UPI001CD71859|nr:TolC family protein [Microbulbifer agarilyticus]MCA0894377.1 TolC family protein [Microbulbifer agarilyticus]
MSSHKFSLVRVLLALALCLATHGCALRTPPSPVENLDAALSPETGVPLEWVARTSNLPVVDNWLGTFDDPVLSALVAEAMANNLDLHQAIEDVEIARQLVVVAGAPLKPQVGGKIGAKRTHDFGDDDRFKHTFSHTIAGLGVTWEMDLWGKLRANRAAAIADYEASEFDLVYARQSLAATVALNWYLVTEALQLIQLADDAVNIYSQLFELSEVRNQSGKSSQLDVVDARARLQNAESEREKAKIKYGELVRTLEVLLGRYPAAELRGAEKYPPLPPPVSAGLPVTLLERRPDIIAAEYLVLAAFRKEESARLALLPDFSLELTAERLGDHLLKILRLSPYWASAEVGATIPIYEGGALCAYVRIATAQQAQAVANYGSVVLNAFREVETLLASESLLAGELYYAQRALQDRTRAVEIAIEQYRAGKRDLLWVGELQAEQLLVESNVIRLRNARVSNRIRLHLALGGGFEAVALAAPSSGGSK